MRLKDKVAVITGAASGIGQAAATTICEGGGLGGLGGYQRKGAARRPWIRSYGMMVRRYLYAPMWPRKMT